MTSSSEKTLTITAIEGGALDDAIRDFFARRIDVDAIIAATRELSEALEDEAESQANKIAWAGAVLSRRDALGL